MNRQFRTSWCRDQRRYFFQDMLTGKSTWSRPEDCDLEIPKRPPSPQSNPQKPESQPPPDGELPKGWGTAFDDRTGRYYYFMTRRPSERTWLRPPPSAADPDAPENIYSKQYRSRSGSGLARRSTKKLNTDKNEAGDNAPPKPTKKSDFFASALWDADACKQRILDAASIKSNDVMSKILVEVSKTNQLLVVPPHSLQVPETVAVSWQDCLTALREKRMLDYGSDPQVTVSHLPVDQAASWFAGNDARRTICCVSASNGTTPGGGYLEGKDTWEAGLCRRMPALHPSLDKAAKEGGLYPFGPCKPGADPVQGFGDTLFTPKLTVARAGQDHGFPVLYDEHRVTLSVLSVVAPDLSTKRGAGGRAGFVDFDMDPDIPDDSLAKAVISMFVAPVYKDPRCTTLVVGPFGVGSENVEEVAMAFAKALNGELADSGMRLGKLYHEVHFALPPKAETEETDDRNDYAREFRDILSQEGIDFQDLANEA